MNGNGNDEFASAAQDLEKELPPPPAPDTSGMQRPAQQAPAQPTVSDATMQRIRQMAAGQAGQQPTAGAPAPGTAGAAGTAGTAGTTGLSSQTMQRLQQMATRQQAGLDPTKTDTGTDISTRFAGETRLQRFPEQVIQDLGTKVSTGWQNITGAAKRDWGPFVSHPSLSTFGQGLGVSKGPMQNPVQAGYQAVQPLIQATHDLIQDVRNPSVVAAAKALGLNTDEVARRARAGDKDGAYAQMTADLIALLSTWGMSVGARAIFGGAEAAGAAAGTAPGEEAAATAAAKTGLPAGAPATTIPAAAAPAEETIQQPLQQGIKETFAKAASETQVTPVDATTSTRDVASHMGKQVEARASENYGKLDTASGGRWQRFNDAIQNAQDFYDQNVGIEDEKAETALENVQDLTEKRDEMIKQLIADGKIDANTAAQANEDYATQSALQRVDRALKQNIRPATAAAPETVHNPLNLERRLQTLYDDRYQVLQRALGEDNANDLLTHVRNSNDALSAIKSFKSEAVDIPATGQARLNEMVGQHTKVQPRLIGEATKDTTDWIGVLNDFRKMPAGERAMAFGNKVATVDQYLVSQAKSQMWRGVRGKVASPIGKGIGLGEVLTGRALPKAIGVAKTVGTAGAIAGGMPVAAIGTSGLIRKDEEEKPAPTKPSEPKSLSSTEMDEIINKAASDNNLDPKLIRDMMHQEDPAGDPRAVSSKGAMGHMQLMPATAKELGVKDPFDPRENIPAGARHMKAMLNRYKGNVALALAAYNAGPKRVDEAGGIPNIKETKDYVKKIMARYSGGE